MIVSETMIGEPLARKTWRGLGRLARQRSVALLAIGVASLGTSLLLGLSLRWPRPYIHDEFSYLLAADTFAHGRVSNPTPPLSTHFETAHVLVRPTYVSKYPPAQGLFLAAGLVATGYPVVGVWLATALACMAIGWMLQGWVRPRWALMGGGFAVWHPTIIEWSQTFWGGSIAVLGGALVMGSVRRLARPQSRRRDAAALGIGVVLLANSRPFEGLVLSLLAALAWLSWKLGPEGRKVATLYLRLGAPLVAVLVVAGLSMGFYNVRTTGSATRMPYMLHEATYAITPPFLWLPLRPEPVYPDRALRELHVEFESASYVDQHRTDRWLRVFVGRMGVYLKTYLPLIGMALPLAALPRCWNDRWTRRALFIALGFSMAMASETWMQRHYAAPLFALVIYLLLQGVRQTRVGRYRGRRVGGWALGLLGLMSVTGLIVACVNLVGLDHDAPWKSQMDRRRSIQAGLEQSGGRHLLIVRYDDDHVPHAEWVFNPADMETTRVLWARDLGAERNRHLLATYRDRRGWLVKADASDPRPIPYLFE